jgi:predicted  nucleic acid-binding Zn-ribbon protein
MRETDALQKQISTFETQIVEILEELEGVEKELVERAEEIASLDSKRDAVLAEFDAALAKDKAEFDAETKHRAVAFATLPDRLGSVYDRLAQRSRDGIAVAEVLGGACSACYMHLRPQVQVNVKKGDEIITCESCTRILYMPKREAEATA